MAKRELSLSDFKVDVPVSLIEELNKINTETDEIAQKACFCQDHNFDHEARLLFQRVSDRTSVYVSVCNALGKYF